jgi:Na+-driven multidrug efflux pump
LKDCKDALCRSTLGDSYFSSSGSAEEAILEGIRQENLYVAFIGEAGRIDRAGDYCKKAMLTGGVLIGLVSALVICTSPILSGCFGQGAEVGVIIAEFFHIVSIGYVLYMLTSCIQGYITGIGRPERAMLLLIAYYIIFRVPPAVILKHIFGLSGIWFAFLVSHVMACVLAFVILCFIRDRQRAPQSLCFRV